MGVFQLTQQRTAPQSCQNNLSIQGQWPHLLSLDHLLVEVVRKRVQRVKLSGSLGAHEHAVLAHQTTPADGDQRNSVAAHPLVQVEVSTLNLSGHRDCPARRQRIA